MRVLLLVNPTASSVTSHKRATIRRILAAEHEVEVAETSRRGHATLLARAAAHDGFDVVAVYAGDGTLNEAANGLLHTHTALAPLPGGSTNVYSQTLGYPRHADDAARALLTVLEHAGIENAGIENGGIERVAVGTANDRPFLFCTGIGFDASVIRRVERHSRRLKRIASHPLHVVAAFQTFFSAEGRAVHVDITIERDDGAPDRLTDVRFAIISKTSPWTFLGHRPLHIAPEADLDTRLSLTAFTKLRVLGLIGGAASSMRSGKYLLSRKEVVQFNDLPGLLVKSETPFPYQVDGDDVGDTDELRVGLEADALMIARPRRVPRRERS